MTRVSSYTTNFYCISIQDVQVEHSMDSNGKSLTRRFLCTFANPHSEAMLSKRLSQEVSVLQTHTAGSDSAMLVPTHLRADNISGNDGFVSTIPNRMQVLNLLAEAAAELIEHNPDDRVSSC